MDVNVSGITPRLLLGVMWTGVGLATIFTIARTTIRFYVSRRLFLDDAFVYFALACLVAMAILYTLITNTIFETVLVGEGQLQPTLDFARQLPLFFKSQFAIILMFWTSLWAVKFSFMTYYRKLFVGLPGHMQKVWWAVVLFSVLAYIGCWITQLLACLPIQTYFNDQCQTSRDIFVGNLSLYYATAVDIVCDIMIMAMPLRLLWGLKVTYQQKIALGAIFSLGLIIIVFAVVRVIETRATSKHVDPMWLALWSMIEASVAVIVACLPSFRAFFSSRASSSYKVYNPSSGSRPSRTPRGSVRLHNLAILGRNPASPSQPTTTLHSLDDVSRLTGSHFQASCTASADGPHQMDSRLRDGISINSDENILPIMPQSAVHVRKDIYMTSEVV